MTARRAQQRGQATVEHVGVVVLALTVILVLTSVMVRSLHPSASPPDLVGRIADRLTAPLEGGPSTPAAPDTAAGWRRPGGEPLQPFWIAMDLHHHEAPIGRWLGAAKDAVVEHLPAMARGCLASVFGGLGLNEAQFAAGAPIRSEMGRLGGRLPGARVVKFLLKRPVVASCLVGAAGSFLP